MKIQLDYNINVDIVSSTNEDKKLKVVVRDFTNKENNEHRKSYKQFDKLVGESRKLERNIAKINKQIILFEQMGEPEKVIKALDKKEVLETKVENLITKLDELGGNEFYEHQAESKFDLLVSGEDYDALRDVAEVVGFIRVMSELDKAKEELIKKG